MAIFETIQSYYYSLIQETVILDYGILHLTLLDMITNIFYLIYEELLTGEKHKTICKFFFTRCK